MKKHLSWMAALASAFALVACGGGGGNDSEAVATADLEVPVNAQTVAALSSESFVFPAVPGFGTTATTVVGFSGTSTTPKFSIASGGRTATGTTTFGSCIFTVETSTFEPSHPLGEGKVVTINPCSLEVKTGGVRVTGSAQDVSATLTLGTTVSDETVVAVIVSENGQVSVNNAPTGQVPVRETTGGT